MLEIKCPFVRKIIMEGDIIDNICPIYYWIQVQQQLECCDLDECDFWQCAIKEYDNRVDFINDTNEREPHRSKRAGFEKGCIIQLLPLSKMPEYYNALHKDDTTARNQLVYDNAKFIFPSKIELSPAECDQWIAATVANLQNTHPNYILHEVLYWRLIKSKCVTIKRDKAWFKKSLPTFEQMWGYIEFFRANPSKLKIFTDYIESLEIKHDSKIDCKHPMISALNADIMKCCDTLFQNNSRLDANIIAAIQENKTNIIPKVVKIRAPRGSKTIKPNNGSLFD